MSTDETRAGRIQEIIDKGLGVAQELMFDPRISYEAAAKRATMNPLFLAMLESRAKRREAHAELKGIDRIRADIIARHRQFYGQFLDLRKRRMV